MADIRMPDGTIIRGVPDGVSKEELDNKLIAAHGRDKWLAMSGQPADTPEAPPQQTPPQQTPPQGITPEAPPQGTEPEAPTYKFDEHGANHGHPAGFVEQWAMAESSHDPEAVSDVGAQGMLQVMPDTAAEIGLENPFDPDENMDKGSAYLRQMIDKFDGDVEKGIAAYHSGATNVRRAVRRGGDEGWIDELGPRGQAYVNELGPAYRAAENAAKQAQLTAEQAEEQRLQEFAAIHANREQLTARELESGRKMSLFGGNLGMGTTEASPEELAQLEGAKMKRLIEIGYRTPEDYYMDQSEYDEIMKDRVQMGIEAKEAAAEGGEPGERTIHEDAGYWKLFKETVKNIPARVFKGVESVSDMHDRIEAQEVSLGQLYLERAANESRNMSDAAGKVVDEAAAKHGMDREEYAGFVANTLDQAWDSEEQSLEEFAELTQSIQQYRPKEADDGPGYYGAMFIDNINNLGYIGAGVLTMNPITTMALMGTDVYGSTYANARLEGRSSHEASMDAFASTTIEAATEGVPVGKFIALRRAGGKSAAQKFLEGLATESAQEVLAESLQIGYDIGIVDKDISLGEAAIQLRDAGVMGAMLGGVIATPVAAFGDNNMANAQDAINEAKKDLQSVALRMQNPNESIKKSEVDAAKEAYVKAVRAKQKLVIEKKEAELEKKKAKADKKETKRKSKLTPLETKREDKQKEQAEKDQSLTAPVTDADLAMADAIEKAGNADMEFEDADAITMLLDAGYAKVTKAGNLVVLPAGQARLKAVREGHPVEAVPDEVIEPIPFESKAKAAEQAKIDEEIGRRIRGEPEPEVIEPKPFKSQERRKAELTARVDAKIKDAKVQEKLVDNILRAEAEEQAYSEREAREEQIKQEQMDTDYRAQIEAQEDVQEDEAYNLAQMDPKSQSGYKGTKLGRVFRESMKILEREEKKALAALEDAHWRSPIGGAVYDIGGAMGKGSKDYANLVKVGALKLARHGLKYSAWTADMVGEFGVSIKPVLARVYRDAQRKVNDVVKLSHAKFATGARKGELKAAPSKYAKPGQIRTLRAILKRLAKEGAPGRLWYEKSGKEILKIAGGDVELARKLAGLLAIYSSGTAVGANMTNALKMWSIFYGNDGKIPKKKQGTIAGRFSEQDRTAIDWLNSKEGDEHFVESFGTKRYPFFQNLMREIDPAKYDVGQGVTVDLWMMRALGYHTDAPTDPQNVFAAVEIKNLADTMGWEKQQAQAAVWVAIKARWEFIQKRAKERAVKEGAAYIEKDGTFNVSGNTREQQIEFEKDIIEIFRDEALRASVKEIQTKLKQSKADFADFLEAHYATISWESVPSTALGLPFKDMTLADKMAMQLEIAAILTNPETGREYLAEWLDLLGQDQFMGPGAWEMAIGSATQNSVIAPVQHKPDAQNKKVQKEAAAAMDGYAAILGFMLQQDAVAWHKPFYGQSMKGSNGAELIGKTLTPEQTKTLYEQIVIAANEAGIPESTSIEWAPIVLDGAVRVINFSDVPNRVFHRIIEKAGNEAKVNAEMELFQTDGGLISNDWTKNSKGEGYVDQISKSKNPKVQAAFARAKRQFSKRIAGVHAKYAKKYGNVQTSEQPVSAPLSLAAVVAGGETASNEILTRFGTVEAGKDTNADMRIYNLDALVEAPELLEAMAREYGFEVKYFSFEENPELGVEFVLPKLKKQGYKDGVVWIYDPRNSAGSFKGAVEYTRAWRISHEIGHAVAERFMQEKYGDSKRYGRLGRTLSVDRGTAGKQVKVEERALTLLEAQRAVEWEDVAFRTQREILKRFGVEIDAAGFNKEFNINLSDAVYRSLTGEFNDPGDRGFTPSEKTVNLKSVLQLLESAEIALADQQGRKPTKGINLKTWKRVPVTALRAALNEQRAKKATPQYKTEDIAARPVLQVQENEYDEIEVKHPDGNIYYASDVDDAINTARVAWKQPRATVEVVDKETGDIITTDVWKSAARIVLSSQKPAAEEKQTLEEFLEEWINATKANPLSPDERIYEGIAAASIRPMGGVVWLDSIRSFAKTEGHGSEALEAILDMADRHGVQLKLTAQPFGLEHGGGLEKDALIDWYERNGFIKEKGSEKTYVRDPKSPGTPSAQFQMWKRPTTQTNEGLGMEKARVQEFMDRVIAEAFGLTNIKVVQSMEELPDDLYVQARMYNMAHSIQGAYFNDPVDGPTIYVVSNNLYNPDTLQADVDGMVNTVMHETFGHFGLQAMLGEKKYNQTMDAIRRAFPKEVRRRGRDMDKSRFGKRLAAEEVFAYMVGDELQGMDLSKVQMGFIEKMLHELKMFLNRMGITKMNRNDMLNMMFSSVQFVRNNSVGELRKRALQVAKMREAEADMLRARKRGQFSLKQDRKDDPDLDRFLDKIGHDRTSKLARFKEWWGDWRQDLKARAEIELLDQFAGIRHAEQELGVEITESGYISVRMTAGTDVIIRSALENAVPVWDIDGSVRMDTDSRGLVEILAPVGQDAEMLKMFEAFIVARRASRLSREGRERLLEKTEIEAVLKYVRKNKLYKLFNQTAKDMAEYKSKVLDFAQASGLIDKDSRAMWEHADHVPFYRVLAKNDKTGAMAASRIGRIGKVIHRLKGGEATLKNPLESIVQNISMLIEASVKNQAMRDVVKNFDGTGVVTKAPQAEMSTALIPLKQVKEMLNEAGVALDMVGDAMLDGIQKLTSLQAPTADNIISVQENGKKQYYYIHDKGVMRGLDNVTPNQWVWLMKALRLPKRVLTRAITLMPDFILKNWFRDIWHSFALSRHGTVIPLIDSTRGWAKAIMQDDTYKDILAGGGMFDSGYVNASDPKKTNLAIRRKVMGAGRGNILDSPRKLAKFYMRIANGAENAHRIVVYQKALKRTGSRKIALFEARDLMDFSVRGANPIIRFLTETVPFWGARVQGIARTGKGFTENPGLTLMRAAPLVLASVALYALNRDDERYKGLNGYEKRMYYHFFDVFEQGDHWRLPKPFEVGAMFSTTPEIMTEYMLSQEPDRGKEAAGALGWVVKEMLMLSPDVQTIAPLYELMINQNRFTESPIISDWEKKLDPKEQVSHTTNTTIREIAQAMPEGAPDWMKSPKKLEHLVKGYFGSMMDYTLVATDIIYHNTLNQDGAQPPELRFDETPFMKSFRREEFGKYDKYIESMYKVMREADAIHNSINLLEKQEQTPEVEDRIEFYETEYAELLDARDATKGAAKEVSKINKEIRGIYGDLDMTPTEKREAIDELLLDRSEAAKDVYDARPGGKEEKGEVKSRYDQILELIQDKPKKEQVDELIGAALPHTATLINDITISNEKLREVA